MDPKVEFPQGAKGEAFVMNSTEQAAVQGNSANTDTYAINVLAPILVEHMHAQPSTQNSKSMMTTKENQATNPPDQNEINVSSLPAADTQVFKKFANCFFKSNYCIIKFGE